MSAPLLADFLKSSRYDGSLQPDWQKESFKSCVPYDEANFASKSLSTIQNLSFLVYNLDVDTMLPAYELRSIVGDRCESHQDGCRAIRDWLDTKARTLHNIGQQDRDIRVGTIVGSSDGQYFLKPNKFCDVIWYYHTLEVMLQIELESNLKRVDTILKLGFGFDGPTESTKKSGRQYYQHYWFLLSFG